MSQKDSNSLEDTYSSKLKSFVNSSLGVLLIGSVIGILGLYTWQRQDWLFKEQYYRDQVILDRQIELFEQVNAEIGSYLARADDLIAVISKRGSLEQRNDCINKYNEQQAQLFGTSKVYDPLLEFYFPVHILEQFNEVIQSAEQHDVQMYRLTKTANGEFSAEVAAARVSSVVVNLELREWNALVLQYLEGD